MLIRGHACKARAIFRSCTCRSGPVRPWIWSHTKPPRVLQPFAPLPLYLRIQAQKQTNPNPNPNRNPLIRSWPPMPVTRVASITDLPLQRTWTDPRSVTSTAITAIATATGAKSATKRLNSMIEQLLRFLLQLRTDISMTTMWRRERSLKMRLSTVRLEKRRRNLMLNPVKSRWQEIEMFDLIIKIRYVTIEFVCLFIWFNLNFVDCYTWHLFGCGESRGRWNGFERNFCFRNCVVLVAIFVSVF